MPGYAFFAWLQVDGDMTPATPATVRLYGDGALLYSAVVTSTAPMRLPAGRYLEYEVQIESKARITKVLAASSTEELKAL